MAFYIFGHDVRLAMCTYEHSCMDMPNMHVATPLWPSVGVKPNTCKVGDLESSGTPECSELNSKAQNISH